jgi:hypothetical protein
MTERITSKPGESWTEGKPRVNQPDSESDSQVLSDNVLTDCMDEWQSQMELG